jgi:hypothetical protein
MTYNITIGKPLKCHPFSNVPCLCHQRPANLENATICGVRRPHPSPPSQPIIPVRVTCYQSPQHQANLAISPFHILPFPLYTPHHHAPTDIRDLPLSADCEPPEQRRPRGRPKTRRMRKGERQRKRKEANVAAHAAALGAPPELPGRAPQRCGQCGGVGHNAGTSTCKEVIQYQLLARAYELGSWTGFTIHVPR